MRTALLLFALAFFPTAAARADMLLPPAAACSSEPAAQEACAWAVETPADLPMQEAQMGRGPRSETPPIIDDRLGGEARRRPAVLGPRFPAERPRPDAEPSRLPRPGWADMLIAPGPTPLWLEDPQNKFWFDEYLPASRAAAACGRAAAAAATRPSDRGRSVAA